jgi:putative endonuclease
MDKSWFLYFVECKNGSVYTGITTNVANRFEKHVAGKGARYTRMNPPVRLIGFIEIGTRSAALIAERSVKRMPVIEKRAWIAANAQIVFDTY